MFESKHSCFIEKERQCEFLEDALAQWTVTSAPAVVEGMEYMCSCTTLTRLHTG